MSNREELKKIERLEKEIAALREENEGLTGRAEDIFLLGVVSEKIEKETTLERVVSVAIENVATLKDIAYSAYFEFRDGSVEVFQDYGLELKKSLKGKVFRIDHELEERIRSGEYFADLADDVAVPEFIPSKIGGLVPNSYYFVPFIVRGELLGTFLLVNCIQGADYLRSILPAVDRVVDIVSSRMENIVLLEQIREINRTLEFRVEERTKKLVETNAQLGMEITERKRSGVKLRESEERLKTIIETEPECVKVLAPDGAIIEMNSAGLAMIEADSLEQVIGQPAYMIVAPEHRDEFKALTKNACSGIAGTLEFEVIGLKGTHRWLETHAVPLRNAKEEIVGMLGVTRDVTDRKLAREELRELASTLQTVIEQIPQGIFLLDQNQRIVLTNPVAAVLLRNLEDAGTGDVLNEIGGNPIKDLILSPPLYQRREIELEGENKRMFEIGGNYVGSEDSKAGIVFVIREITSEREFEEKMQSQDRIAAVGQLAAGIAHDFNNVLTGIIGYAEILLMDKQLSEKHRQKVDSILKSGERAALLIRQILDFSRRSMSMMKPFDMKVFIKEFLKFIKRTIPENIGISFDCEEGEYTVNADDTKIQQVLANLVLNARDAMPKGGKLVLRLSHVSVDEETIPPVPGMQPGKWVALTVSDSGAGIASEALSHIFEPFFTTKESGEGTGLGLSQVYGIVRQHNGFIDVKTEHDKGTEFIVYLPSIVKEDDEVIVETDAPIFLGHGETILVVEDDASVLDLIGSTIMGLGYKLITAINGKDAIAIFEEHRDEIRLVVTDIVMPEMGGVELSTVLKEKDPAIKVIALSGYPIGMDEETLARSGIVELMQKPINLKNFAEIVHKQLA
ncbi:MAG: ATP-binding protein [Thermodesulfovibrionales bacterium]